MVIACDRAVGVLVAASEVGEFKPAWGRVDAQAMGTPRSASERPGYHADLVEAVRGGSTQAYAVIFDVHAAEVLEFIRRRSHPDESEDLLSVVFLEAWRCRHRAAVVDGTLRPWLYGIALNVLRNSARSRRRQAAALSRYRVMNTEWVEPDHADRVTAAVAAAAASSAIAAAFNQLSVKERQVADLVLREGFSLAAAACALSISEAQAKSRLAEGRRRLQRLLRTSELSLLQPSVGHEPGERHIAASVKRSSAQ